MSRISDFHIKLQHSTSISLGLLQALIYTTMWTQIIHSFNQIWGRFLLVYFLFSEIYEEHGQTG